MSRSTITIQASALIDAPAEQVYDIIADYRNGHPHILPSSFFQSLVVEKGGVGEGTVIRVTSKLLGQTRTSRMTVSEPQPRCVIREMDEETGIATTFRVSPEHRGHHAHVTIMTEVPRSPGIKGSIEAWVLPRMLQKVYVAELQQLAAFARKSPRELVV
jgi:hypothetical protein